MSTSEKPTILITGATGFIGSHVLHQLLEAGYPVRATARPSKVDALKLSFEEKIDVVPLADLVAGDYTEAFKGIGAIIHVASPLPGAEEVNSMINSAVEGTMNILRQAAAAGIKRIVITSSVGSMFNLNSASDPFHRDVVVSHEDWNTVTVEDALAGKYDAFWVYCVAKTAADRAVRKFESAHPEIDITTIHPPYVYGPLVPGVKVAKGEKDSFSTFSYFWKEVMPEGASSITLDRVPQLVAAINVDVRDVARAHVLALTAPLASEIGHKRLIVAGPSMPWIDAVAHLRKVMPELEDRLPKIAEGAVEKEPLQVMTFDVTRTEEVLGLGEYIDWRKTAEDTVKCILEVEKSWETAI